MVSKCSLGSSLYVYEWTSITCEISVTKCEMCCDCPRYRLARPSSMIVTRNAFARLTERLSVVPWNAIVTWSARPSTRLTQVILCRNHQTVVLRQNAKVEYRVGLLKQLNEFVVYVTYTTNARESI